MNNLQYLLERQRLLQKVYINTSFYDPNDVAPATDNIEQAALFRMPHS